MTCLVPPFDLFPALQPGIEKAARPQPHAGNHERAAKPAGTAEPAVLGELSGSGGLPPKPRPIRKKLPPIDGELPPFAPPERLSLTKPARTPGFVVLASSQTATNHLDHPPFNSFFNS